jgi:hypothetical protein
MGLMPTPTAAPSQDAPAPDDSQAAQPGDDQESNVSPEEQQQYETVMHKAADIIYGNGKVMPEILKALEPAKDAPPAPQGDGDGADAESAAEDQGESQPMPGDGDGTDTEGGGEDQGEGQPPAPGDQGGQQAGKGNPAVMALANTATQVVQKLDTSAKEANFQISDDVLYHAGAEIVGMLAEIAEAANIHSYSEEEIQGAFFQAVDNYRPIAERMGRTDDQTLKAQFGQIVQADEQGKLGELLPGADSQQGAQPQPEGQQQPGY